jgi:hypothetical protein
MPLGASSLWIAWDAPPLGLGIIGGSDSTMETGNSWADGANTSSLLVGSLTAFGGGEVTESTRTGSTGAITQTWASAAGKITAGRTYLLWVPVRPAVFGTPNRAFTATITWKNVSGTTLSTSAVTQTEETGCVFNNGWTLVGLVAVAPATATQCGLTLSWAACLAGEAHQYDAVTMDYLGTNESGRLLAASPNPARGRNDELDTVTASGYTLLLGNQDGKLTPGAAAPGAPYTGNVIPRRKVVLLATVSGALYPVWAGYIQGVPQAIAGRWSEVSMACTDGFRWLSGYPLGAPYRSEVLSFDDPDLYLPCDEAAGSSSAGNLAGSGGSAPLVNSKAGGHYAFGEASVLQVNNSGATSDNGSTSLGLNFALTNGQGSCLDLTGLPSAAPSPGSPWTFEAWYAIPAAPGAEAMIWRASVGTLPDPYIIQLAMAADGGLVVSTGPEGAVITTFFGWQGTSRQVNLKWDPATGAHGTLTLVADNAETISYACTADPWAGHTIGLVQVGGILRPANPLMQSGFPGDVGHIATYSYLLSAQRINAHNIIGKFGGSVENEGNRAGGILNMTGWPQADTRVDLGLTTLLERAWAPSNALALIQSAAAQGGAVIIIDAAGKLCMQNRQSRVDVPSRFTFKASTQTDAETSDFAPTLDDTNIFNVIEIDRQSGGTTVLTDATSIAQYGQKKGNTITLSIASEAEATSAGQYHLLLYKDPHARVATVTFRPDASTTSTLFQQILSLEFGDRITLDELPSLAPATTADYFVERIAHTMAGTTWITQLGLSPVSTIPGVHTAWKLDDPVYGALDSGNALTY